MSLVLLRQVDLLLTFHVSKTGRWLLFLHCLLRVVRRLSFQWIARHCALQLILITSVVVWTGLDYVPYAED